MTTAMSRNDTLFAQSQAVIPGGVNSPVRAFKSVGGTPVFFAKANGAYVWDADGKRYTDYVGSWGPAILGHAHPGTVKAVQDAAIQLNVIGRRYWITASNEEHRKDRFPLLAPTTSAAPAASGKVTVTASPGPIAQPTTPPSSKP